MGGFVMLFDYDEIYMDMMTDGEDEGDDEDDGPGPVWMDWQTVTSPGDFTMTELPEGDWVVIVSINCQDPDTGDDYGAVNINGPWSLYNTTFTNGSTTSLSVDLQIMDEGEGDDMDYSTGEVEFTIRVDDSADGYTALTMTQKVAFSDFFRSDIDCGFGDCNGEVSETESTNAILMFEMMGLGSDDDDEDDGTPGFMWNGVELTEADLISEDLTISGLVGDVPQDESEDTGSISMTTVFVYMLVDSGETTQVLSPAPDNDGGDECPFDAFANNSPCSAVDENGVVCDWKDPSEGCLYQVANYCAANWDEHTMEGDYGCEGEWSEDNEGCGTINAYVEDSSTWTVASITGGDVAFTYDSATGNHHAVFNCDDESDDIVITFTRVIEEPEPTVNTPPTCDVYWYGSDDSLADGKEGGHEADEGTETGDFDIELTEGATYTLMFYCMDAEDDEITVTVDPSIGETKTMTGNGSLSGYYEFTIPTGTSALGEMSFDYDWTDGTNTGDGTVTVNVLEGSDAGGDDDTKSDDTSAGSFVPGFTAVLTMTALAGAFLVFSRREEE
jgi:hypothetical protein